MLFLGVFAFNLLIMAIDFPRFTIVAVGLLLGFVVFFILWIGAAFDIALMNAAVHGSDGEHLRLRQRRVLLHDRRRDGRGAGDRLRRPATSTTGRSCPNEILHHHGPLSDLERYPDDEPEVRQGDPRRPRVPAFLGLGPAVLHVTEERKAIVLDNVLFINSIEAALKKLMSRMEVRVTTDQEVADM